MKNVKKILIFGATGCIGQSLVPFLRSAGHHVVIVSRYPNGDGLYWDPLNSQINVAVLEDFDVWINLAGEPIAGIWTKKKMRKIVESRVAAQKTVIHALLQVKQKPCQYITASAIGWYGIDGQVVDEESQSGTGFLAEVCRLWEAPLHILQSTSIKVVTLRIGLVFSKQGGMLKKLLLPFRFHLGAYLGSGQQWMSLIAIDDLIALLSFIMEKRLSGIYNATCPHPIQHRECMKLIGPVHFHIPEWVIQWLPHDMGREIFLTSQRVLPKAALEAGFYFRYPTPADVLQHLLSKNIA